MDKIKVLIADNSQIYALGLTQSLSEEKRIEVFNHIHRGQQVIDMTGEVDPDIVLIGSELLFYSRTKLPDILQKKYPTVKVIVLVPPEKLRLVLDNAIDAGIKGILPKDISPTELVESIFEMVEFGSAIHSTVMPQILEKASVMLQGKQNETVQMSVREREVMELVATGRSDHDIAETLFISQYTVKGHLRRIKAKLGLSNRVEIARYMLVNK